VATGAAQSPKPSAAPAKQQPAQPASTLGPEAEFLSWQGETALFREETYGRSSTPKVAYYALTSGSRVLTIPPPKSGGPTESKPGRVLLADYIPTTGETAPVFHLDADPKEVDALGSAIAKWIEEGTGKLQTFPIVHATLAVTLDREGLEETVWKQRRNFTATAGEAGYVYDPPRLRFAVISPAGSTLLIELVNDARSEFIRIPLQKKK
jgi:hypothetical protein